jgi:hypothetical protein
MPLNRHAWPSVSSDLGFGAEGTLAPERYYNRYLETDCTVDSSCPLLTTDEFSRMTPNSCHLYAPLHGDTMIRLIELKAGKANDPLSAQFYHVNVCDARLKYEALSYVWFQRSYNDSSAFVQIMDHRLKIGVNLGKALRALRSEHRSRILWVDAISINQEDVQERNHQVSLMSSIYTNASQVTVWLGELEQSWMWENSTSSDTDTPTGLHPFGAICEVVNHWLGVGEPEQRATYRIVSDSTDSACSTEGGTSLMNVDVLAEDGYVCFSDNDDDLVQRQQSHTDAGE